MKRCNTGFWLENTNKLSTNCIVEYKYNKNRLKHLTTDSKWPPSFVPNGEQILRVFYDNKDVTNNVLKFAGPLKRNFNPFSLFTIVRRPRLYFEFLSIKLSWCEYIELIPIDPNKLLIRRGQVKFDIPQVCN